ncbi:alpha/beta hydrolase family protein [Amycolatopsis suaedae]|uniref:Alpha/beta hydrolase n=1 Tax=Amycolatopsis suaedae TaxID=2510978 RepID=A0A4Q7IZX6_9PSEU|nr:lipase family protein [Amycolatopsis suaedae]RZQ59998.1 alpha/beta hydrolase [Amycolatopsis suaedae]
MTKRRILAATLGAALAVTLVATPASATGHSRGELLSTVDLGGLTAEELTGKLAKGPLAGQRAEHGVDSYRVTYRTIDPHGKATTASGLVVLPRTTQRRLDVVSYLHGTRASRHDVASVQDNLDRTSALLLAAAGDVVTAPDYLGLGTGPGKHPYMHTASETTASVDLLRAARELTRRKGVWLDPRVRVTGFSQGGKAAMAVGRALRSGADRHFRLGALAPIAGPYDIEHAELPGIFDGRVNPRSAMFYLAYYTVSMNRLYPIYRDPAEVFREPYAAVVEKLFDNETSERQIMEALPATPAELFTESFMARLRAPSGVLLRVIRDTDGTCADWRPGVPVLLFAGRNDTDVPFANAENCAADLRSSGAPARVMDAGAVDHFGSWFRSLPKVRDWFAHAR